MALVSLSGQAKKHKQLVILHTNDTHSAIFPINAQLPDTVKAGRGGFLRRIAMLKEERAKHPDLLYFDSGDFFQGSAYFRLRTGEYGGTVQEGKIPHSVCELRLHGYRDGGCHEALDCHQAQWSKDWCLCRLPEDEGTDQRQELRGKCDIVICISHLGWNSNRGEDDQYMIERSRNIDLVLGGHTHTYMPQLEHWNNLDGKPVPVDQNGKSACFVGKMVLDLK